MHTHVSYEIFPASADDAEAIGKLRAEGWYEQYGQLVGIDTAWIAKQVERITSNASTSQRSASITESFKKDAKNFWRVARLTKDNSLIGFIDARKLADGTQEVHSIHVMKEFRNQGIGQALMDTAHAWFDPHKPICVDVAEDNLQAQSFYQKHNKYQPTHHKYLYEQLRMMRMERK